MILEMFSLFTWENVAWKILVIKTACLQINIELVEIMSQTVGRYSIGFSLIESTVDNQS